MKRLSRFTALIAALALISAISLVPAAATGSATDEGYDSLELKTLKAHLTFLASNLLEGREATTRGYDIAAGYAVSLFQDCALKPIADIGNDKSFLQVFPVVEIVGKNNEKMQVTTTRGESQTTQEFINRIHFIMNSSARSSAIDAPVVFAGYGLVEKEANYDDYAGLDVRNKIVVVMTHAPGEGDEHSYFYKSENRNRFFYGQEIAEKRRNAQERGALALLLVNDPLGKYSPFINNYAANIVRKPANNLNVTTPRRRMELTEPTNENPPIPLINITDTVANAILRPTINLELIQRQINQRLQPASSELAGKRIKISTEAEAKLLTTANVIGLLEGSDEQLKNEYVIIGAHLDHDGTRDGYIWNGADDDASGSAAVLALASAFTRAKTRPRRSILFCLWGAEEKGLLGSQYFTLHPLVPLENISAVIQLDMIGRDVEPRAYQLKDKPKPKDLKHYIFTEISAQSPELGEILQRANETVGMELNFEASKQMDGGSDHYPFFLKKVPSLAIDDGVYHEDYHQPTDTVEKINFEKVLLVSRLTYLTAREIANNGTKLKWDEPANH